MIPNLQMKSFQKTDTSYKDHQGYWMYCFPGQCKQLLHVATFGQESGLILSSKTWKIQVKGWEMALGDNTC